MIITKMSMYILSLLTTASAAAFRATSFGRGLLALDHNLLVLLLLIALLERLPRGYILLRSCLNSWMVSDVNLILLYLVEDGFRQQVEYLLHVCPILCRCFNEWNVSFFGESEPLLK